MKKLLLIVVAAMLTLGATATIKKNRPLATKVPESIKALDTRKNLVCKTMTETGLLKKEVKDEKIVLRSKAPVTSEGTKKPYTVSGFFFFSFAGELSLLSYESGLAAGISTSKDGSKVYFDNLFPSLILELGAQGNVSADGSSITIPSDVAIADIEYDGVMETVYPVELIVEIDEYGNGTIIGIKDVVFAKDGDKIYIEDDLEEPARYIALISYEEDGSISLWTYELCVSFEPVERDLIPVELPKGAEPTEFIYYYNNSWGDPMMEKGLVYVDGNEVYMNGLTPGVNVWVKGTQEGNIVTFPAGHYLGIDNYYIFYTPFYYGEDDNTFDIIEIPSDYELSFDSENGIYSNLDENIYSAFGKIDDSLLDYGNRFQVRPYGSDVPAVPSDPYNLWIDDSQIDSYGQYCLNYTLYPLDVDDNYMNFEHLSYIIYFDDEPYTLTPDVFKMLDEDMTLIPFGFTDGWDIYNGSIWISEGLFNTLGIQAVYIVDGVINFSNVVSVDLDGNVTKSSVHPIINTSLSIVSPTNTINIGESITLSSSYTASYGGRRAKSAAHAPTITPIKASNQNLNWWSSNANYATVSNGVVTGKGEGMVNIFAETTNGSEKDASCMIRVKEPDDTSSDGHIYALRGYLNSNYYQCIQQEVKGLTADGKSQVFIPMKSDNQPIGSPIISITDPDGNYLNVGVGQNEKGSISSLQTKFEKQGFVYTAPNDFFADYTGKYYLAKISVPLEGIGYEELAAVRIYRPGLLLVHGLWGDATSFEEFGKYLDNNADYKPYYQLVDYKKNNSDSFYENTHDNKILKEASFNLYGCLMDMGILSARYDFVGHSMGGILSRLYIQEDNNDAAHKIITVNTPHWGSGFADRGDELRNVISLLSGISPLSLAVEYAYLDNPAIYDLKSSSPAIKNLGKGAHVIGDKSIPVHAVCSVVADAYEANEEALKYLIENDFNAFITASYYMTIADMAPDGQSILNWIFNGDKHDGIVELTSQQGGLSGDHCTIEEQLYKGFIGLGSDSHHMKTTKWAKTHKNLESLLKAKTTDPLFDRNGFKDINASQGSGSWAKKKNYELPVLKAPASENTYISIASTLKVENDSVKVDVTLTHSEDIVKNMVFGFLNEDKVITGIGRDDYTLQFPNTYSGSFMLYALGRSANDEIVSDSVLLEIPAMAKVKYITFIGEPSNMSVGQLSKFSVKAIWSNGEETYIEPEFTTSDNTVLRVNGNYIEAVGEGSSMLTAIYEDHTTSVMLEVTDYGEIDGLAEIRSEGEYKIYNDGETLYVEAPDARIRNIELRLFDASGTLIQNLHATTNGNKKAFSLDLGNRKGLFVVQCISDDFKGSYRFVY